MISFDLMQAAPNDGIYLDATHRKNTHDSTVTLFLQELIKIPPPENGDVIIEKRESAM